MSSFWQWLWGETPPSPSSLISCSGAAGGSSSSSSSSRLIHSSDDLAEENVIVSRKAASPPRTKQQQQEQEIWEAAVQRLLQDSTTTTATITNKVQPATILTHVAQRQRWDCGLACLQMVFHWIADDDNNDDDNNNDAKDENKNKHNNNNKDDSIYEWLVQHVGTQSVWTVDLVILLHEKLLVLLLLHSRKHSHQANFLFTTRNLTVNPDFSNLPYYKAAFQQDARRVQARIDTIRELKLPAYEFLSENTVSMRGVIKLVQRPDAVAIVLVDNAVLRQSSSSSSNNNGSNNKTPYAGHYIILAGIVTSTTTSKGNSIHDDNMDEAMESFNGCCFVVYNPALDGPDPVHIPIHHIEKAWKAKGTDQDIIFVTKKR